MGMVCVGPVLREQKRYSGVGKNKHYFRITSIEGKQRSFEGPRLERKPGSFV